MHWRQLELAEFNLSWFRTTSASFTHYQLEFRVYGWFVGLINGGLFLKLLVWYCGAGLGFDFDSIIDERGGFGLFKLF